MRNISLKIHRFAISKLYNFIQNWLCFSLSARQKSKRMKCTGCIDKDKCMRNVIVIGLIIFSHLDLFSQERIISNHYFLNPYIYNPAYAGRDFGGNFTLNHRQQWRGIDGAPVTTYASFDIGTRSGLNFGLKFISDKKSILNTTKGYLTLGYTLPFTADRKSSLTFALSGGASKLGIDIEESYNYSDPAVVELFNTEMHFLGEFGIYYRYYNFNLGVALPALLNAGYTDTGVSFDPLNELLFTVSNKFVLTEDVLAFEPHILYRMQENQPGQFEGTAILHFYDAFWIGAAYRQDYGASGLVGFRISPRLQLGYAYEMASSQVDGFSKGSHEIHLNLAFSEVKKKPRLLPRFRQK